MPNPAGTGHSITSGHSRVAPDSWEPLATLALDAAYEATLLAVVLDADAGDGSGIVWLTFLGGGVFRNPKPWIASAIGRALRRCEQVDLDVRMAHFGRLDREMHAAIGGYGVRLSSAVLVPAVRRGVPCGSENGGGEPDSVWMNVPDTFIR